MANVPSIDPPRCWELCLGQRPYANLVADARLQSSRPVTSSPGAEASQSPPPSPTNRSRSSGSVRFGSPFRSWGGETGNSRGFFGSVTGPREDKMRGPELFSPAEPAMGNFASLVGATLVLDAAEKWACLIRYCNNATVVILRTTALRGGSISALVAVSETAEIR